MANINISKFAQTNTVWFIAIELNANDLVLAVSEVKTNICCRPIIEGEIETI